MLTWGPKAELLISLRGGDLLPDSPSRQKSVPVQKANKQMLSPMVGAQKEGFRIPLTLNTVYHRPETALRMFRPELR